MSLNDVTLMGRLTRDPDVRSGQGEHPTISARYTLAVDRPKRQNGEQNTDFITCVAFGKRAQFVEKYLFQGTKIVVKGSIRTGSYTNRDGVKVYTTEVWVSDHFFCEGKKNGNSKHKDDNAQASGQPAYGDYSQNQNYQRNYGQPPAPSTQAAASGMPAHGGGPSTPVAPFAPAPNAGYQAGSYPPLPEGFMNIPDGIEEELPFN